MPSCVICNNFYERGREMTCSEECHDELARHLIDQFGEFKKVIRMTTGEAFKVPTRDIIERGLREKELDRYPLWKESDNEKCNRVQTSHSRSNWAAYGRDMAR